MINFEIWDIIRTIFFNIDNDAEQLLNTMKLIAKNYPSVGSVAEEKCAKLYKFAGNYSRFIWVSPPPLQSCKSVLLSRECSNIT